MLLVQGDELRADGCVEILGESFSIFAGDRGVAEGEYGFAAGQGGDVEIMLEEADLIMPDHDLGGGRASLVFPVTDDCSASSNELLSSIATGPVSLIRIESVAESVWPSPFSIV